MDLPAFQHALLAWYDRAQRDLPWRRHALGQEADGCRPDPVYAVWISEAMLQQTQVATVLGYYQRFLARFPTVQALAAADLNDVLATWAGLGYYARARHLHRAAQALVHERGGAWPRTYDEWRQVPGVGPYTAAAIASIAHGEARAVVDGNVVRVLSRLSANRGDVSGPRARGQIQQLADQLLDPRRPGDYNQAVMELGATLCTPKRPQCLLCPVHAHCAAHAAGLQDVIPRKRDRVPVKTVRLFAAVVRRADGAVLLVRRPASGLWGGLWEVPNCPARGRRGQGVLTEWLAQRFALQVQVGRCAGRIEHLLTHRRVRFQVYPAMLEQEGQAPPTAPAQTWCQPADWSGMAISTATRRVLNKVAGVSAGAA